MTKQPSERQAAEMQAMWRAIAEAATVRSSCSPNPWVGAAILSADGQLVAVGATQPPGGRHAEIVALATAGQNARGATLVVTLEPCAHHGRTPPCTDTIIEAGVRRVVVAVTDPDSLVAGAGIAALRAADIEVEVGLCDADVADQLMPYLHHRRTGRPYVVAKMAATLDGGTAAPDGTSQWITGEASRQDVHRLRAESDAILVGANTVRTDNPALTVRHVVGPDPMRIVLGRPPADAAVHPCLEWVDELEPLLDHLGHLGVLQLMVEGGASVIRSFHDANLIDRYVLYLAPAFFGGNGARPLLAGATAATMSDLWRGQIIAATTVGSDVRIELIPQQKEA